MLERTGDEQKTERKRRVIYKEPNRQKQRANNTGTDICINICAQTDKEANANRHTEMHKIYINEKKKNTIHRDADRDTDITRQIPTMKHKDGQTQGRPVRALCDAKK